jgi:hypothetical protein
MQKESRKCDSLKVAFYKKDQLIEDLVKNNLSSFEEFILERNKKAEAIKELEDIKREMKNINKKRFSLGITVGPALTSSFKIEPAFMFGLSYSLIKF